jgi:hypothetical protein
MFNSGPGIPIPCCIITEIAALLAGDHVLAEDNDVETEREAFMLKAGLSISVYGTDAQLRSSPRTSVACKRAASYSLPFVARPIN